MDSPPPPFAPEVFSVLLELCDGDDLSTMESVINQFFDDLGPIMRRLTGAVAASDFAGVRDAAHSLKGSSATFGLLQVEQASSELERAATAADRSAVARWSGTLRDVLPLGCEAIRAHMVGLVNRAKR